MAHGIERLERLFTGSKRKERATKAKHHQQLQTVSREPSSPVFPSPSFLRPTSMHMVPRDAQVDGAEKDRGRSRSVPSIQETPQKRSSGASSITVVNNRNPPDMKAAPWQRQTPRNIQSSLRLSRFRFPEDSLFKQDESVQSSKLVSRQNQSRDPSPRGNIITADQQEKQLLGWSPKHISLLFNPLDFSTSTNSVHSKLDNDGADSILLPSPDIIALPSYQNSDPDDDRDDEKPSRDPTMPVHVSPLGQCSPVHGSTPSGRQQQQPASPCVDIPYTMSSSDSDDNQKPSISRSRSLSSLSSPRPLIDLVSPVKDYRRLRSRLSIRETWGSRPHDAHIHSSLSRDIEGIPRSRLVRKSASTSTLSILTSQIAKDHVLKEPTFDDFFALSDDDIAESRPPTPEPDARDPPTPPPKDSPEAKRKSLRKSATPQLSTMPTRARKGGELTPPYTPTQSQVHILQLPYSPTRPREVHGAVMAADLAQKYNFSVVYVLKLWPADEDAASDARTSRVQRHDANLNEAPARIVRTPPVTGCLLAAYGLHEVPSPFEVVTETHMAALKNDHWNEYRNANAVENEISRGWMRPITLEDPEDAAVEHSKERGILFAAYAKQTPKHIIPMTCSPEQTSILQQLHLDASMLVKALMENATSPSPIASAAVDSHELSS
ncbi:hypothetical protein F5Y18DRAFT_346876 [Xylariaceae sp. FL1019]|nr:hypothetical protein F5Y18DRAFT_346876 [Xylariaceae sp. FL1019]